MHVATFPIIMNQARRLVAVAIFAVCGAATAFAAGAKLGSTLDHETRATTVARVPMRDLAPMQTPSEDVQAPPSAIARNAK